MAGLDESLALPWRRSSDGDLNSMLPNNLPFSQESQTESGYLGSTSERIEGSSVPGQLLTIKDYAYLQQSDLLQSVRNAPGFSAQAAGVTLNAESHEAQARHSYVFCPPKDHTNCVVAEGAGSTVQVTDLNGRGPSLMTINLAPACMGNADSYAQAVGVNSNVATCSAQGQHTDDAVIQGKRKVLTDGKLEQTKRVQRAPKNWAGDQANALLMLSTDGESEHIRRGRAPNWAEDETKCLLKLKLGVLMLADIKGKPVKTSWSKVVSEQLLEKFNIDRSASSCQDRWDTLFKYYKGIRENKLTFHQGTSNCDSFWKMDEDQRRKCTEKLPGVFWWRWYVLMKSIILAEADKPRSGTARKAASASSHDITSTITGPSSSQGQVPTIPPGLPLILASTQGNQQPEGEVLVKGMSDATVAEDDLIARITPSLNKLIEDALKHYNSVSRSREEEEQKLHRDRMLVIEEEKLALKREKMLFRRIALTNSMEYAGPYGAQAAVANMSAEAFGQPADNLSSPNEDYLGAPDWTNLEQW